MKSPSLAIPGAIVEPKAPSLPSAKTRERQGKFLIVTGTVVALLGVVIYCATMLVSDANHEPARFLTEGLMTIGAGLAVWLIGTFRYLNAVMDLGASDESF